MSRNTQTDLVLEVTPPEVGHLIPEMKTGIPMADKKPEQAEGMKRELVMVMKGVKNAVHYLETTEEMHLHLFFQL